MEREPWHHQPSPSMGAQHMRTAPPLSKDSLGPQGATGCCHSDAWLVHTRSTCNMHQLGCCGTS